MALKIPLLAILSYVSFCVSVCFVHPLTAAPRRGFCHSGSTHGALRHTMSWVADTRGGSAGTQQSWDSALERTRPDILALSLGPATL